MLDRRQSVRDKVIYGGVADIGERGATTNCIVRNISEQGACVEFRSDGKAARAVEPAHRAQGPFLSCTADLVAGQLGRPRLPDNDV